MLLFFAVDIGHLRWHDLVLLTLVFVILEFLLLVACNAIQVKKIVLASSANSGCL